jgi:hypothetical protein
MEPKCIRVLAKAQMHLEHNIVLSVMLVAPLCSIWVHIQWHTTVVIAIYC